MKGDIATSQQSTPHNEQQSKTASALQARLWRSWPVRLGVGALIILVLIALGATLGYRLTHTGHDVGDTLTYTAPSGNGDIAITLLTAKITHPTQLGGANEQLAIRVHFVNNTVGDLHFKSAEFLVQIGNASGFVREQGKGVIVQLSPGKSIESQMIFQLPGGATEPELFWFPYVLNGNTDLTGASAPCWWYLGYY